MPLPLPLSSTVVGLGRKFEPSSSQASMISRDTIFGIGSLVGYFSLFVGVLGQMLFLEPVTKPHLPGIIAVLISLFPGLVVFTVTFTKQRFLPPRPFRFCLVFAMCWFATLTIVAEILHHLGYMPSNNRDIQSRIFMHMGWLSLLFIVPLYVATRRDESKRDAKHED
jgi:hypothetical protein